MPDIFDEVDQDLRADRARALMRRYGAALIAAACLIVAGIGGYEFRQSQQSSAAGKAADQFIAASLAADALGPDAKPDEAIARFEAIAAHAPAGYRTLARLRVAGLKLRAGDLAGAGAQWDAIAADDVAPRLLRDLANLQWAQHAVDAGDPAAVEARLRPLTQQDSPFHALALETRALLSLRVGHPDAARDTLRQLAVDPLATPTIRDRARGMLSELGETLPPEPQRPAS